MRSLALLTLALVVASAATGAHAQAVAGPASIEQIGEVATGGEADVGSRSAIVQNGRGNAGSVVQVGAPHRLDLRQDGEFNVADVRQHGGIDGIGNAAIVQQGVGNAASVEQQVIGRGINRLALAQDGTDNRAVVRQQGADLDARLSQAGAGNQASVSQSGEALGIAVSQYGGAAVSIVQSR